MTRKPIEAGWARPEGARSPEATKAAVAEGHAPKTVDLSHLETLVRELNAEETSVFRKRALIIALADECVARLPALLSTLREQRKALEAIIDADKRQEIGSKGGVPGLWHPDGQFQSFVEIARTALEGEGL